MDPKELRLFREAYGSIYATQKEEIISESECEDEDEMEEEKPSKKDKKNEKKDEGVVKEQSVETQTHIPPMESSGSTGGKSQLPKRTRENAKKVEYYKDDVDLFDIVKGHLMSEGYADTEEAALAIMTNMSEEWRQSIVEMGLTPDQESRRRELSRRINKAGTPGNPGVDSAETRKMQGEYIGLQKLLKGV